MQSYFWDGTLGAALKRLLRWTRQGPSLDPQRSLGFPGVHLKSLKRV
jgi:hypothetical protein